MENIIATYLASREGECGCPLSGRTDEACLLKVSLGMSINGLFSPGDTAQFITLQKFGRKDVDMLRKITHLRT